MVRDQLSHLEAWKERLANKYTNMGCWKYFIESPKSEIEIELKINKLFLEILFR